MKPPKVLPPHYFVLAIVCMAGLGYLDPSTVLTGWWPLVGIIPIGMGVLMALVAARQFAKADTNIIPLSRSTALVTDGVFALTRNPMYTGMTAVLMGIALLLNSYLPWVMVAIFVAIIRVLFIRHEEALMEETFGEEYLAYKSKVRRWI